MRIAGKNSGIAQIIEAIVESGGYAMVTAGNF
jgi:hypothetical protein